MGYDAKTVREDLLAGHQRLIAVLDGLTDDDMRAPSALPDWSRGHVCTHLAHNATAFARQTEYALAGRLIDFYDGGREAEQGRIETGAGRPAAEITAEIRESVAVLEDAWTRVGADDWTLPVRYRDGNLLDTLLARWREVEIHTVDLRLSYRPRHWTPEFSRHALEFLSARVPQGIELTVSAGDYRRTWGSGAPVEVSGALTDIVAVLAGRAPDNALSGGLPTLDPWP
jgi:maleylpyruvate isomerase